MKRINHILSGFLLSEIALSVIYPDRIDLISILSKDQVVNTIIIMSACISGSLFPDIDIKIGIKHRGLTHWFPPYVIIVILSSIQNWIWLQYFSIGCLLHIVLDSFTKAGVPFLNPYRRSFGLRLMVVDGLIDKTITFVFCILFVFTIR